MRLDTQESPLRGTTAALVANAAAASTSRSTSSAAANAARGADPQGAAALSRTGGGAQASLGGTGGLVDWSAVRAGPSSSGGAGPAPGGATGAVEVDAAALRHEVDSVIRGVEAKQKEFDDAALAASKAQELMESMQAEIKCVLLRGNAWTGAGCQGAGPGALEQGERAFIMGRLTRRPGGWLTMVPAWPHGRAGRCGTRRWSWRAPRRPRRSACAR